MLRTDLESSPPERAAALSPLALAALAAWLAWCVFLASHYFSISWETVAWRQPAELFPALYWREALSRSVRGVVGCTAVVLAGWTLGRHLLRGSRGVLTRRFELPLFELFIGLSALSVVCLGLSAFGLYRPRVVQTLVALLAVGSLPALLRRSREVTQHWKSARITSSDAAFLLCGSVACAFGLLAAFAPEIEYDALWYHLWLPSRWLSAGRPVDIVEEYISLYPMTWDLLSGCALSAGGSVAAKLLHFICLPAMGLITGMLASRWFPSARASAAGALAVAVPLAIWEAGTAYVDLALACYVALAAYALTRCVEERRTTWLVLASVSIGTALAIKSLGLVPFALASSALGIIQFRRAGLATAIRTVALFALLALLLPAPWYLRAWRASGNPVFPDLYAVFGARPPERWDDQSERALRAFKERFGRSRTPAHLIALPWDMTMHAARYKGTLGPVFLMLIPVAILGALRRRPESVRVWAVTGAVVAYGAIWASPVSSFQVRFLVPIIPLLATLSAEALSMLPKQAVALVVALLAVNLPPFTAWHEADRRGWEGWLTHTARAAPLAVVIGAESQQHYLERAVESYRAWSYIDAHLPAGARVLTFSGGDHFYTRTERISSDSPAARPATWALPAGREADARGALARLGVTHILFDRRQLEAGPVGHLAIGSEAMRACCLERLYEDGRFAVYGVR